MQCYTENYHCKLLKNDSKFYVIKVTGLKLECIFVLKTEQIPKTMCSILKDQPIQEVSLTIHDRI